MDQELEGVHFSATGQELEALRAFEAQFSDARKQQIAIMLRWQREQRHKAAAVRLFRTQGIKSGPLYGGWFHNE